LSRASRDSFFCRLTFLGLFSMITRFFTRLARLS
jgi:hypothetical protein